MPRSGRLFDERVSITDELAEQPVVRTHRKHPLQCLDAGRSDSGGMEEQPVAEHAHEHRADMPARREQPADQVGGGRALVEMEGLRIEFGGKGDDLRAADTRSARE